MAATFTPTVPGCNASAPNQWIQGCPGTYDDGGGGGATVDLNGQITHVSPSLTKMGSWTQTSVLIGLFTGLALGASVALILKKKPAASAVKANRRRRMRSNDSYIADAHRRAWAERIGGYLSQWQGPGAPAISHVASYLSGGHEVTRERVTAAADEMEQFLAKPTVRAQDKRGGKTVVRALRKFARGIKANRSRR